MFGNSVFPETYLFQVKWIRCALLFPLFLILLHQWMVNTLYIFNPLNHPEETPQVFYLASAVHRVYTIFIARQSVALLRMRALLCFAVLPNQKGLVPLIHPKAWVFWVLQHYLVRTQFSSSVLQTTVQIVVAFSRLALGAYCVQEPG